MTLFTACGLLSAQENISKSAYSNHFDDFEKAIIASVNHAGDTDSTGAITGNILGAAIGYEALPEFYKKDLELHEVIIHVADDLYEGKVNIIQKDKKHV